MTDPGVSGVNVTPGTVITRETVDALPEPVARYLRYSGVVGKSAVGRVRIRQAGRMRSASDKPWMPITAVESYSIDPPGFDWKGTVRFAGFPLIRPHDVYAGGRGRMKVTLAGLVKLWDLEGAEMDQGSLMRYFNEMVWFPTAFLGENITWSAIDERSAQVAITDHGRTATATMYFDELGRPTDFVAHRHRHLGKGRFSLDEWATPITEHGELGGFRLPVAGRAEWRLASETLVYAELRLTSVEYDGSNVKGDSG
jgi:hypothetical protein